MNATVNRIALTAAAKLASDTADPKATQELLAHALLRFTRKGLVVAATDLTTSIWSEVPFPSLAAPGSICVDARRFSAAVASLPGADVSVSVDDKLKVTLKSGKATVALAGRKGEDFPAIPDVAAGSEVPPGAFAAAIKRAYYARSVDEARFHGMYFLAEKGNCSVVALDGHRMAVTKFSAPEAGDIPTLVVPNNGISQLAAALEDAESASLSRSADRLSVKAGPVCVSVKLSPVAPMPWTQIIPAARQTVRFDREELLAAVRRSGMMAGKEQNGVDLTLTASELTVESALGGTGEASTTLDAKGAKPAELRASWRYLADALAAIDGEVVEFDYEGEFDPIALRSPGSPEVHVIMPQHRGSK